MLVTSDVRQEGCFHGAVCPLTPESETYLEEALAVPER